MTIYRGPGGTGTATSDSDTTEFQEFVVQTVAARDAALAAQTAAELAEANAETAETNAETAETNAETAATNAASSASSATSSASSASSSASAASTSASSAASSASSASTSATAASSSASSASTSASNAATSATNAASSATAAASSATSASSSASTATTQASNASGSATAAASSASAASASATNASNSASSASTSATNAATSATAAAASATAAAASAASIDDVSLVHKSGAETITGTKTFNANQVISVTDNTNAALRITQTGTGNALVVEDSANPDSSAFIVNSDGRTIINGASAVSTGIGSAYLQINGGTTPLSMIRQADATTPINVEFAKARAAGAILNSGDTIGRLYFSGSDGTAQIPAAYIDAAVDSTPGTNDMPGRLVFSTTADGASSPTERVRVNNSGAVGFAGANFGNSGQMLMSQGSAASPVWANVGMGFRNRIINGDMRIDQRNAGASVTPAEFAFTLDRWQSRLSQSSKYSIQQSTNAPPGFSSSLLFTSLSAYSVGVSDYFDQRQAIEGFNFSDLGWGTTAAQSITVSFWVRSSLTGTFGGSLKNGGSNRSYPFTYTVSAANTWEQKALTIPGDTTGTWLTTNGIGVSLIFGFGHGSTYSGTAGAWASANYLSATGATSVVGTNGATFYITGVQLEAGSVASPFERRDYGRELQMCQRYFEKSFQVETAVANGIYSMGYLGYVCFSDQWVFAIPTILFKTTKRAAPTIAFYGTSTNTWQLNDNNNAWNNQSATGTGFQGAIGTYTTGFSAGVHNGGNSGYAIGTARMIRGDWTASSEL